MSRIRDLRRIRIYLLVNDFSDMMEALDTLNNEINKIENSAEYQTGLKIKNCLAKMSKEQMEILKQKMERS